MIFDQVLQGGVLVPASQSLSVGSALTDLSLRILDQCGDEIALKPEWFDSKSSGLRVSWEQSKKKNNVTTLNLADIEVGLSPLFLP
jgi:hypothetical protein